MYAVPLSSSFFAGRLLNCLHHEVRSRFDDAGSGVATGAGSGFPLRTRGVWGLVCVPAGIANGLKSCSLSRRVYHGRRSIAACCGVVLARHEWVAKWARAVGALRDVA